MADPETSPPPTEHSATLAHVLAVQGALRATLESLILAGTLDRAAAARLMADRAREMRRMTDDPDWRRAAVTLDVWAVEVGRLGTFAK